MSHLLTLEEFEAQCNSQIEVAEDAYGPWMMRVHMRRWRYQQLYPHLPLARPDQDWMMFLDLAHCIWLQVILTGSPGFRGMREGVRGVVVWCHPASIIKYRLKFFLHDYWMLNIVACFLWCQAGFDGSDSNKDKEDSQTETSLGDGVVVRPEADTPLINIEVAVDKDEGDAKASKSTSQWFWDTVILYMCLPNRSKFGVLWDAQWCQINDGTGKNVWQIFWPWALNLQLSSLCPPSVDLALWILTFSLPPRSSSKQCLFETFICQSPWIFFTCFSVVMMCLRNSSWTDSQLTVKEFDSHWKNIVSRSVH